MVERIEKGVYASTNSFDTQLLGEMVGMLLRAGDVIVLSGDLGAGKTQFTKGVARGMGVPDDVTSPTFALQTAYQGTDMPLFHFDLYRLSEPSELGETGLFDVMGEDGVCIVEWGDQFADDIGKDRLDVVFTRISEATEPGEEPERWISLITHNDRGEAIVASLDQAVLDGS